MAEKECLPGQKRVSQKALGRQPWSRCIDNANSSDPHTRSVVAPPDRNFTATVASGSSITALAFFGLSDGPSRLAVRAWRTVNSPFWARRQRLCCLPASVSFAISSSTDLVAIRLGDDPKSLAGAGLIHGEKAFAVAHRLVVLLPGRLVNKPPVTGRMPFEGLEDLIRWHGVGHILRDAKPSQVEPGVHGDLDFELRTDRGRQQATEVGFVGVQHARTKLLVRQRRLAEPLGLQLVDSIKRILRRVHNGLLLKSNRRFRFHNTILELKATGRRKGAKGASGVAGSRSACPVNAQQERGEATGGATWQAQERSGTG